MSEGSLAASDEPEITLTPREWIGDGDFRVAATVSTEQPNPEDVHMAPAVGLSLPATPDLPASQQSDIPATQDSADGSQFTFSGEAEGNNNDNIAEARYFDQSRMTSEDATDFNLSNGA